MTYTGNRLTSISKPGSSQKGFKASNSSYNYDINGNMTADSGKGINSINYNHLNLPESIAISRYTIGYTYDASGVKIKKIVDGQSTEYSGATVYKDNNLEFIHMPEGYIEPHNNGYRYVYRLTDHLGNTRVSFFKNTVTDEVDVLATNDYYPFGLEFSKPYQQVRSSNIGQNYKYNQGTRGKTFQGEPGKYFRVERQTELGLDMTKFRMFDYTLGRFTSVDPLAEVNPQESLSTYQFGYNNPIRYNDPYGDCPWCFGAGIGAIVDIGIQLLEINLDDSKTIDDFSWSSVGVSAVAGATGVGLATKLKKVGTLTRLAVEVGTDAAASAGTQLARDGEIDITDVGIDAAIGRGLGETVGKVAKGKFLKSGKGQRMQEMVNQQKNAARGKSNTISKSKADVKGAQRKRDQSAAARAVGASTASAEVGSTVANGIANKIEDEKKKKNQ